MAATRSPQEVLDNHAQALGAEDLEEIVADYGDDAIFITPAGVLRGKDGILFLEWSAEGGGNRIEDAVDTFVFRDGLLRVRTVRYTLQPAR